MATDSSLEKKTTIYQDILIQLDVFDKVISGFLFRLSLPPIVEAIYSVPANFFGLVPSLAIGPLWVALLALEDDSSADELQHGKILLLKGITLSLTTAFLVAWALFQNGSMPLTKILARKHFYLVAIFFNITLLSYTLLSPPSEGPYAAVSIKAFSHAIYLLFLWPPSILVIVILKEFSQRPRPIVLDKARDNDERWLANKSFPSICHFLAKAQANESFPSGDATSATIVAIVLIEINDKYTTPAICLWALACTGRIYFLAHHVLDVLVGSMLAGVLHKMAFSMGLGIYDMVWWHPLASTTFLAIYVQTIMKNKQKIA
uniref:Phosphatidic acid phosphatase type 2/haloperoxidase domain-containing protein n=1 Tax=Pseudo-nitzschia delicatissima TaxID=44447 RepID=A0A7S0Y8V6_9STRA|mmetsp:Transcript_554/g.1143  ORF Transcript_554/g.1143 Transcript_554/m.1143 type:complete len:318 (+) Transcript_554:149-1102(+)|eukprot:CAMPEP_0197280406 /NCGR_PEP_ID=MMETSP1432-20130617/21458_1 /TAXON_ID=44447 /ORGANISM="Pseudo-nitzschia delicatissima, Strain UNC1205" /LENGTH=317 /DNA_ID=CAMNT_0042747095 /DNA_START=93 /DNA_END=1046 /DNA_ORIENTATION=+